MRIAIEREHAIGCGVVDDRVGVLSRVNASELLERLEIEHHDRLVVPGRREAVPALRRDRGAVRAVDAGHLAEQLAVVLIDNHHTILASDEHTVVRRIGNDVVPAALSAEDVGVRDAIGRCRLRGERRGRREREDERHDSHVGFPSGEP